MLPLQSVMPRRLLRTRIKFRMLEQSGIPYPNIPIRDEHFYTRVQATVGFPTEDSRPSHTS
jgi:hypothetical protein